MPFTFPLTLGTWLAPLGAFAICWLTLAALLQRSARLPMDHPNERSLHVTPTPRVGGTGIMAGLLVASVLIQPHGLWPLLLGALALTTISLLDDFKNLPISLRLMGHVAVAIAAVMMFSGSSGVGMFVATLAIVWMTNLYNFMDGADGLAGGMAVFGFGALAVAAKWAGAPDLAWFCASIAAAALAFLRFNFPPARLFMGDAGSIPLGFLAATTGVYGVAQGYWPVLFPVMIFSPFILDASVTLIKRAAHGKKIWRAHHDHYYQRLVRMGWGHKRMTVAAYVLMLLCAVAGLLLIQKPDAAGLLTLLWAAGYFLLFIMLDWRWSRSKHEY